jgi:hypothetical protein
VQVSAAGEELGHAIVAGAKVDIDHLVPAPPIGAGQFIHDASSVEQARDRLREEVEVGVP